MDDAAIQRRWRWQSSASLRCIRPGSPLKSYLERHTPYAFPVGIVYRIDTLLTTLYSIFKSEGLLEPSNPAIVCCDEDLQQWLDVKHFFLGELRRRLTSHLIYPPPSIQCLAHAAHQNREMELLNEMFALTDRWTTMPPGATGFDMDGSYLLKPAMAHFVWRLTGQPTRIMPYKKLCRLISNYIIEQKYDRFDLRNIRIYIGGWEHDLLCPALGVTCFDRRQVTFLIRHQLDSQVRQSPRLLSRRE